MLPEGDMRDIDSRVRQVELYLLYYRYKRKSVCCTIL